MMLRKSCAVPAPVPHDQAEPSSNAAAELDGAPWECAQAVLPLGACVHSL